MPRPRVTPRLIARLFIGALVGLLIGVYLAYEFGDANSSFWIAACTAVVFAVIAARFGDPFWTWFLNGLRYWFGFGGPRKY